MVICWCGSLQLDGWWSSLTSHSRAELEDNWPKYLLQSPNPKVLAAALHHHRFSIRHLPSSLLKNYPQLLPLPCLFNKRAINLSLSLWKIFLGQLNNKMPMECRSVWFITARNEAKNKKAHGNMKRTRKNGSSAYLLHQNMWFCLAQEMLVVVSTVKVLFQICLTKQKCLLKSGLAGVRSTIDPQKQYIW